MISWLIEQTVVLTLLCSGLLLCRTWLSAHLGEQGLLKMFGLIPLSLLLSWLVPDIGPTLEILKVSAGVVSVADNLANQEASQVSWLLLGWLTVAGCLMTTAWLNHYRFIKRMRAQCHDDISTISVSKRSRIKVIRSSAVDSPCISGILKPRVFLPVTFEHTLSAKQQQLILEHECSHLEAKDLVWNHIAGLIVVCFWFNPLILFTYRRFREVQETACDERTLRNKTESEHLEYAKALLACVTPDAKMQYGMMNYTTKETLKMRLTKIKSPVKSSNWKFAGVISLTLFALMGTHTATASADKAHTMLKPETRVPPKYPAKAIEAGLEGSVVLNFSVTPSGSVTEIEIKHSDHDGLFDASAMSAVSKWQYAPVKEKVSGMEVQLDYRF